MQKNCEKRRKGEEREEENEKRWRRKLEGNGSEVAK
jgi:hypothetical protein